MFTVRKRAERGRTRIDWLDSWHTFSFGDYYDPGHHQFRSLRVINDDRIAPDGGFGTHPHRDMEILTYVLSGELEHRDSMGHGEVLRAGEWQAMSAGAAEPQFARDSEYLPYLRVRNAADEMIFLEKLIKVRKTLGPTAVVRVNGYRATIITAAPAAGKTPAEVAAKCVELARHVLPKGYRVTNLTGPPR